MRQTLELGTLSAAIVLFADLLVTLNILNTTTQMLIEKSIPWLVLTLPVLLVNTLGALRASRFGITALPFGPNTVFIVAVLGGAIPKVLSPLFLELDILKPDAQAVLSIISACILFYTLVLWLATLGLNTLGRRIPPLPMLIPLAGVCWCYLVASPLQAIWLSGWPATLGAILLFLGLLSKRNPVLVLTLSIGLYFVLGGSISASSATYPALPLSTLLEIRPTPTLFAIHFWTDLAPLLVALALANALSLFELLNAAWSSGDTEHSLKNTAKNVSGGSLLAALMSSSATLTLYIGHSQFKKLRGGAWYALIASILVAVLPYLVGERLWLFLPIAVLQGAIVYVGFSVGRIPLPYLSSPWSKFLALIAISPIFLSWTPYTNSLPLLKSLTQGGSLVSLGWSILFFAELKKRQRAGLFLLMGLGAILGLIHGSVSSQTSSLMATLYFACALWNYIKDHRSKIYVPAS